MERQENRRSTQLVKLPAEFENIKSSFTEGLAYIFEPRTGLYTFDMMREVINHEIQGYRQSAGKEHYSIPVTVVAITVPTARHDLELTDKVALALQKATRGADCVGRFDHYFASVLRWAEAKDAMKSYVPRIQGLLEFEINAKPYFGVAGVSEHQPKSAYQLLMQAFTGLKAGLREDNQVVMYNHRMPPLLREDLTQENVLNARSA